MIPEGYKIRSELTLNTGKANIYALIFFIPVILVFSIPYFILWIKELSSENLIGLLNKFYHMVRGQGFWFLLAFLAGIILHELIHGITMFFFCKNGFHSIKFGFMWQYLTPYVHCKEPLQKRGYVSGAVMPSIVLGVLPGIAGILFRNPGLLIYGIIFTYASAGDFLIVWLLRNLPKDALVLDHEAKVGCYLLESDSKNVETEIDQ
jgi:hypothetical protein